MSAGADHITVFLQEAVSALNVQSDHWYIDATYGRGGHTRQIIKQGGRVIAFDVDQEAIEYAQTHDANLIQSNRLILIRANFDQLEASIKHLSLPNPTGVSGVIFDFGTSSNQLMSESRGFSFESSAQLDMRMDQRLGVTAEDMLRVLTEKQLAEAFSRLGGEREAKKVAATIKRYLMDHHSVTAREIAEIVTQAKREKRSKLHPATKVFQALRIMVNTELDSIERALPQALNLCQPHSRIVTIAFHEGEDRLAKQYFATWEKQGKGQRSPKEAIVPSIEEQQRNPRSRSAKMRIFIVC